METSTLRWILVIAGIALLAGLFVFGNPNRARKSKPPRSRRRSNRRKAKSSVVERQEPMLDDVPPSRFEDDPSFEPRVDDVQPELDISEPEVDDTPSEPPMPAPDKVVVLYLQARDNRRIAGDELLAATLKSGLEFGDMDIFHRLQKDDRRPVFSLANLTSPGTFDPDAWNTFETHGVTLFMGLPGPMGSLDAWDAMLATARRLADLLHLDLLSQEREPFTRKHEGEVREDLRAFERSRQPDQ
ncbi:cell division protein ZipA [Marinihelvus fidelis]|uniref:Cell division protein ZipA n=1 Tax=Marinihelvus fidelis TaxID=2613842 RepID=A0A5N0TII1_9GAMM|nr:cell division protein ZipA [Marinihelvus fidelis]KAA9133089.1 cell division protein ZipA [Marinihelvus fidelis]